MNNQMAITDLGALREQLGLELWYVQRKGGYEGPYARLAIENMIKAANLNRGDVLMPQGSGPLPIEECGFEQAFSARVGAESSATSVASRIAKAIGKTLLVLVGAAAIMLAIGAVIWGVLYVFWPVVSFVFFSALVIGLLIPRRRRRSR